MGLHLGIEIGRDLTVAAVERDGRPGVVRLRRTAAEGVDGAAAAGMPSVAHVGVDGSVAVGERALERAAEEPGGLVTDVLGRLGAPAFDVQGLEVDGELLVGHLLADVVGQVVARYGRRPDAVRLVHPDGWALDRVEALLVAADDAGIGAVAAVAAGEARAALRRRRLAAGDPSHEAPIGAALLAAESTADPAAAGPAAGPAPAVGGIVTREDLEGPAPPPPLRPPPRYETSGPRSVFETQVAPGGYGSAAPTSAIPPVAAGAGGGAGGWGPPPVDDDEEEPGRWIWAAVAGVAALVVVLVLVLLLSGGGDGEDVATTSTTTSAVTTTVPGTSTTVPGSTTSLGTTTTVPTTTTPSTTTSSTTTTTPGPSDGLVGLADFGLVLRPGTTTSDDILFGEDADTAVNLVRGLLGSPTSDSGWVVDEVCEGTKTRRVRWGALEVTLTQDGADDATDRTRTFTQWFVDNTDDEPANLRTLERVGVGDRIEAMEAAYGGAFLLEVGPGGRGRFEVTGPAEGLLEGVTSGITPVDVILRMWSGSACERPL